MADPAVSEVINVLGHAVASDPANARRAPIFLIRWHASGPDKIGISKRRKQYVTVRYSTGFAHLRGTENILT
jgi:hypothetical protein